MALPFTSTSKSVKRFTVFFYKVLLMLIVDHVGTCSISAQSNFAVGAVVNASFGSITELTFYITALLKGNQAANPCLQEIVKSALTGTLLGCILFIPVSQPAFMSQFTAFNTPEKRFKLEAGSIDLISLCTLNKDLN